MNDRAASSRPGHSMPAFAPAIGLREVLDAAPDLVFSCDAWGRLAWASMAFESLTGRRAADCVGDPCPPLIAPSDRMWAMRAFLRQLRQGTEQVSRRMHIMCADGRELSVEANVRFVMRADGERYLVGVARECAPLEAPSAPLPFVPFVPAATTPDSTSSSADRMRLMELESQLTQVRSDAQLKTDLLSTMSREVRTPMNGLLGTADLVLKGELQPEQRRLVELIQQSSQHLLTLLNDTLDYTQIDAGRLSVEFMDFDLRVTVEQTAALLAPAAQAKNLAFDIQVDSVVPSRVKGDPGRLRQVLLNLAGNAIKFTETGSVQIRVDRESEDDHRATLVFHVADTGVGMTSEEQANLFQAYTQADASAANNLGASGLGLAISHRLVALMGGEVGASSEPGEGSTFWFRLPFDKQATTVGAPAPLNAEVVLRGLNVLVADGNAGDREPLADLLSAWGCSVSRAENGVEAFRALREAVGQGRAFDVAIVDQYLDGMDGEELGRAVRADHDLDKTQLVLVTHMGRPGDGVRLRALGYSAYLVKPVDVSHFHDALCEVVARERAGVPLEERALVTRHSIAEARRGRLRILLVDDDAVNQLVTTSALHRSGYNIEVASNGRRAIELTENERWDLILMDMQMPDLDGCRTTAAIRARERGMWRTPILGLTANADHKADRDRCLASGMDLVLGKPIDLAHLTKTVERYTSRGGEAPPAEPGPSSPAKLTVISGGFEPPAPTRVAPAQAERVTTGVEIPLVPDGPAVDLEQLNLSCMGLATLRTSLLHTFLNDMPARLERLRAAFDARDARRIEFEAHGLRGMCATIGAGGCTMLFGEMEMLGRDDRAMDARSILDPAIAEVARTESFIRRLEQIVTREAA